MTDHYFSEKPSSLHDERVISINARGHSLSFLTDAGVFSKARLDAGSEILIKAAPEITGRALDLGCGWGAIGISLARAFPDAEFVLSDVNARAVSLAELNIARNGAGNASAVQSDGLASVQGYFDIIFLNPPIRAGKDTVRRLFLESRERLNPGGALFIVIRKQQGAPSALAYLAGIYSSTAVVAREKGYHVIKCVK